MVTKIQILEGQFSSDGSPWILVGAKPNLMLTNLSFSLDGSPWYGIEEVITSSTFKPIVMWFL